ncbi:MAG: hypothetical protein V3U41_05595 [candidate division NC10 bacterium]
MTFAFVLFAVAFGPAGCALWQAKEPDTPLREATLEELTELLRVREHALQTVKALFTAQVKGPGLPIAQTVYGTMFYRRADVLRLQGFTRFGGKIFDFTLEAGVYKLRLPQEGKFFTGPPAELGVREGLSQPLRLSVLAMSGLIGIAALAPSERAALVEDEDRYRLDVHVLMGERGGETPVRRIWFDRRSLQVVREDRLTSSGEIAGTLELGDFRAVGQASGQEPQVAEHPPPEGALTLPFKILAIDGRGQGRIRVTFSELTPNVPLDDDELRLALRFQPGENNRWREAAGD